MPTEQAAKAVDKGKRADPGTGTPSAGLPCQFANMRSSRHEGDQSLPVVEERSGGTTFRFDLPAVPWRG